MFKSGQRIRTVVAGASLATLLCGAILAVGSASEAITRKAALPPSTAHGLNFLFEASGDISFCIDEPPGNSPGRNVILSKCTTADTERWALTENLDGTNAIIDSQGMCVDSTGRKAGDGLSVEVIYCRFQPHQRFSYTASGQIQAINGCLSVPGDASGASVSLVKCNSSSPNQLFKLAH